MQALKQLNKQAIQQKVDLEYNIDFLGRALSKAEMYAFRFGDQEKAKKLVPRFGYYNRFNNNNEKEKMDLFKSFVNSVKFVDYGLEETEDNFNEIIYPANMSKEEIMKYVIDLSCLVNSPQEKAVYNDFIHVLLRIEPNYAFYKGFYNKDARMNQKSFMDNYAELNKAFGQKEANWKIKYENNPELVPGFELNKNSEDDKEFNQVNKRKKRNQKGFP
jgi:hypothetical protein